jgi:hypothetical protein
MPLRQFSGRWRVAQMPRRGARSLVTRDAEGSNRPQTPECRECRAEHVGIGEERGRSCENAGSGATGSPRWETNAQLSHSPRSPALDLPARGLDAPVPPASTSTTMSRRWNASFGQWALDSLDTIQRSIRQRRCSMVRSIDSFRPPRPPHPGADAIKTE